MKKTLFLTIAITMFAMVQSFAQDKKQMTRIARIEIDPAQLENYKAAVKEVGETSLRAEPGVLMLFSVTDKTRPNHITVMEIYADSATYAAHRETAHFKKYKEVTKSMVKSLELTEVEPIFAGIKPDVLHQ